MQSIINPRIGLGWLAWWSGCNHGMAGGKPMNDENCGNLLVIRGVQSGSHVVIPEVAPHVCQELIGSPIQK
jgi:hypothetical protein